MPTTAIEPRTEVPVYGEILGLGHTKLMPVLSSPGNGGWSSVIRESYAGAWQSNVEVNLTSVQGHPTVFACKTQIAGDMAKLWLRLVQLADSGIWIETTNPAFSPFLRKPNRYQNRLQYVMQYMLSKVDNGNTYVLKERDQRGVVVAGYVLDPTKVTVLIAPDGSVYYQLGKNEMAGQPEDSVTVPASEIMHDRMYTPYHPLIGVGPLVYAALPATQGLKIQENSTQLFSNGANPGGVLTAPGAISDATAARLKTYWDANYTGANVGKVAVLGDGLKFEAMSQNAVDAQLIQQLDWSDIKICSCYKVPPYKVHVGPAPPYNGSEGLDIRYYSDCLQVLMEAFEMTHDDGLGLGPAFGNRYGTEFDRSDLFLMDSPSRVKAGADAIGSGGMSPNEARRKYFDLGPVEGGDTPYLQQQQFSLAALSKRDRDDPFSKPDAATPAATAATPADAADAADDDVTERFMAAFVTKAAEVGLHCAA